MDEKREALKREFEERMTTPSKPPYRYIVHFEEGYDSDYTWSGQRSGDGERRR